jgi:hypothetical protein
MSWTVEAKTFKRAAAVINFSASDQRLKVFRELLP